MSDEFDRIPTETVGRNRISDLSTTSSTNPLDAVVSGTISGRLSGAATAIGKGLDIGTANLLSAVLADDGETVVRRERNMFLEIPREFQKNRAMLTKLNVPYVTYQNRVFVIGNSSFELANMFGKEVRRPMKEGFLSPNERDAIALLRFIIERLLGEPTVQNEPVHFSVPAPSVDTENDTVYHEGVITGVLKKLGYLPTPINEAHAVVYSELGEQDFTGVGISCGGGMFNVCVAYRSIPGVTFSIGRGGDWIDAHVAKCMGIPLIQATDIKESGIRLTDPRSREEEAIVLYYRNLIDYVLEHLAERFSAARDVPRFTEPVDVVLAGGTSLPEGFAAIFAEELSKLDLPLKIARVRRAEDALSSVARGCLIAAGLEEE